MANSKAVPHLEHLPVLDSTNDRLLALARLGVPHFSVVLADAQRRGRGREGKPWSSAAGAGLWMSVLLPDPPGGPPGVVPLAVGVAVAEALEARGARGVGLKWPNDLVMRDGSGALAKCGGILCERAQGEGTLGIVAGIGVNLVPPEVEDPGLPPVAVPLSLPGGGPDREWMAGLAGEVVRSLRRWADPPPDRLEGALREAWMRRDFLVGREVQVVPGPRGRVTGVGEDGALLLAGPGGAVSVRAGSVRVLPEGEARPRETGRQGSDEKTPGPAFGHLPDGGGT